MKVLAIDPGGTTGYCEGQFVTHVGNTNTFIDSFKEAPSGILLKPYMMPDDCEELWDRLDQLRPDIVVMESFEYRNRSRAGLDLTPVKLIGVAELYSAKSGARLYMQTPSQGKTYYTDTLLKKYGFYKRGQPHAMDALRHMLQWLSFGAGYQYLGKNKIEDFVRMT